MNKSNRLPTALKMYCLALRNARSFSALHTDVLVFVARGILTVYVIICYQVYKVLFADSRSLDGISGYRSVNFLAFVFFLLLYLIVLKGDYQIVHY